MKRPKAPRKPAKSDLTRELVLKEALALFRKRGFDRTTMRDIARAADLSLGAAYYYFPSKAAIVLAYYTRLHEQHLGVARAEFAKTTDLRVRLKQAVTTKLDLLARDRKLLGALFRSAGEPGDPEWVFGAQTKEVRDQNIAVFAEALAGTALPDDLRAALPTLLWLVNAGILLYFVNDRSKGQERTRRLVDGLFDLLVDLVMLAGMPGLEPMRARALALLAETGLV
jgi:AcrR family transcriptional regulator